jgi:peroxiredoxin
MAGTVAEVDSPERLLWLSSQVSSQVFTVVVFLRGHWCPFDKANAQVWEYYHTAIQENNGKLIGIVTHDADYCTKIITHWKLSFNLLSDPEAIIAANYSVPLTSTNQTPFKPGYEQAKYKYNQAGVVVLTPNTDQPLYIWRTNPQFSNFDGASGRPMPKCILDNVLHQIKGSPGEPPK